MISVISLIGATVYAFHWEELASVDWEGRFEEKKQVAAEWIETHRRKSEQETGIEANEKIYFCQIAYMSHEFPEQIKLAEENDILLSVPLISQEKAGYRTGCELTSAAMVLQYYGVMAEPEDVYEVIVKDTDLKQAGYQAHPDVCFIGNPKSYQALGCYVRPLADAMNVLLTEKYHAVNVSGSELEDLVRQYLRKGTPVILWATIDMEEPGEGTGWELRDGSSFQWIAGEHCLVLVGADEKNYYFNDPNHAGEAVTYEKEVVQERYEQLGRQAIIISR